MMSGNACDLVRGLTCLNTTINQLNHSAESLVDQAPIPTTGHQGDRRMRSLALEVSFVTIQS